jgi:phenylalanyl-tRNA synthetase beta chain
MKTPLKWLLELCPYDGGVDKIVDMLTMSGTEVESVEDLSSRFEGVVIGLVKSIQADNPLAGMFLCEVEYGEGKTAQVLSRAPNIAVGNLYPFAPIGARLFGGKVIGNAEFEGVSSEGMLCSGVELGLGDPKDKLLEIAPGTRVGADVKKLLQWDDVVIEMEVTPNRPDCYGILGLARELSALTGVPLEDEYHMPIQNGTPAKNFIDIRIEDPKGCPRYSARVIENLKIAPSPLRIMGRLSACGIRPINNVVDATNYVMMLLSHPLHAFDLDKLGSDAIIVRNALQGEIFTTLDSEERKLSSEHLLITTPERPVAIAGVMGGLNSEVDEKTTRILLESAYFNPRKIRRASRQLGLITDSSVRFERGADPNSTVRAADECASLIAFTASAEVCEGVVDVFPSKIEPLEIPLNPKTLSNVLGIEICDDEYSKILIALGLEKTSKGDWKVPTFRPDLTREIDLVEEVGRIYGYSKIDPKLESAGPIPPSIPETIRFGRKIAGVMNGLGFTEAQSDPLGKGRLYKPFSDKGLVELENPISEDFRFMRPAILPSLLSAAAYNLNRQAEIIRLYEYDKVYLGLRDGEPYEEYHLAGVLTGLAENPGWQGSEAKIDIFDLKGVLESLYNNIGLKLFFVESESEIFAKGKAFTIEDSNGEIIGHAGQIAMNIADIFDIDIPVYGFEIETEKSLQQVFGERKYAGLPIFPSTRRDVALIVDSKISAGEILDEARKNSTEMLEDVYIFDVYEGKPIPFGKKSIGVAAVFRSPSSTITDKEANVLHGRIVDALVNKFDASIRD